MKNRIVFLLLFLGLVFLATPAHLLMLGCGQAGVTLDTTPGDDDDAGGGTPETPDEDTCEESSADVDNGEATAVISGSPCKTASVSASETDNTLLLSCDDGTTTKTTTAPTTDFVTVTCGDGTAENVYYCSDGIVYLSDETELYAITSVACSDDNTEITDTELEVGLKWKEE